MKSAFLLAILILSVSYSAQAQVVSTQERFQDLFTTAGYGTAFGAALGTAILPFQDNPEKNLRLVAIGASIGFIGGSLLGSYIVFSPGFSSSEGFSYLPPSANLAIGPMLNENNLKFQGVHGIIRLASF